MRRVELIEGTRVTRKLRVIADDGTATIITYDGAGLGYERVLIDGHEVIRKSGPFRMVPRFDFRIGDEDAVIEIDSGWVLDLFGILFGRFRRFSLHIDGELVYEDTCL